MIRDECAVIIKRVMGDRSMTIVQIMEETGYSLYMVNSIVQGTDFERVGLQRCGGHGGGSSARLYRVRTIQPDESVFSPLDRPLAPSLMKAVADHVDTARMVGIWARRGDKARAMEMLTLWWQEDVRINELCRGATHDNHTR
jgi:hypothetical protein